jgi:hypothetical protein
VSIKAHGGAVRYWVLRHTPVRFVLCNDGVVLCNRGGSRWHETAPEMRIEDFEHPQYRVDTRPTISSAITRTNRAARRDV